MAYVYRHIRLDKNEPFYIGIGADEDYKRAHEKCPSRRSGFWTKIARKTEFLVEILIDDVDVDTAKAKEMEFIKLYGRKNLGTGPLCNLTDGGDGLINIVFTEQHRQRLSAANRGRPCPPERREKIRQSKLNNPLIFTDEIRKKISEGNKGKKLSPEHIALLKQRTGKNNPMYGKRNNYRGDVVAFKDGFQVGVYEGVHKAAAALGVDATKISACILKKRKTTKGYTFTRLALPHGVALIELPEDGQAYVHNKRIKNGRIV